MADDSIEKTATAELSKRVLDDRKDGDRLKAAAQEHAPRVAKAIADELSAKHGAAVEALVKALAERIVTRSEAMVAADVKYTIELSDDAAPRNERDKQERLTREQITDVRERITGLYGSAFLSKVMLAASAPRDARQLATFAVRAADAIAGLKDEHLPAPKIEGGKPSLKKWTSALRTPAEALAKAIADVEREAAEAVTALAERNARRDEFEAFLPKASDLVEGLMRFAGMNAEADRLPRPVASGSSGSTDDQDGGNEGGDAGQNSQGGQSGGQPK